MAMVLETKWRGAALDSLQNKTWSRWRGRLAARLQRPPLRRPLQVAGLLAILFVSGDCCFAGDIVTKPGESPALVTARVYAAAFLRNATFGPTMSEIDALAARMVVIGHREAAEEWIDDQFALPVTSVNAIAQTWFENNRNVTLQHFPENGLYHVQREAFNTLAIEAPDQLRQRVAFALSQILVVNHTGAGTLDSKDSNGVSYSTLGLANYWDELARGTGGAYRQLLGVVAVHPVMGQFLTHLHNSKTNPATGAFPDENFAREIMQLFTIGLWKLNQDGSYQLHGGKPISTYGAADIETMARVFTGLTWNNGTNYFGIGYPNYRDPMRMHESYHDTAAKTLLNGVVLPAGRTGMQDINDALDMLDAHPNTAPFIARRLIQRLTASNPSKAYIRRIADVYDDNGQGVRGDLRSIVKAILLDPDATDAHIYPSHTGVVVGGCASNTTVKVLDPYIQHTTLFRAFHVTSNAPGGLLTIRAPIDEMPQVIVSAPSVFNFFRPDDVAQGLLSQTPPPDEVPNGYYSSPELTLYDSYYVNNIANSIAQVVYQSGVRRGLNRSMLPAAWDNTISFSTELQLAGDLNALLTHLDLLLCSGSMKQSVRDAMATAIARQTDVPLERVQAAVTAVLLSPDFMVTETLPLRNKNSSEGSLPPAGNPIAGVPIITQPVLIEPEFHGPVLTTHSPSESTGANNHFPANAPTSTLRPTTRIKMRGTFATLSQTSVAAANPSNDTAQKTDDSMQTAASKKQRDERRPSMRLDFSELPEPAMAIAAPSGEQAIAAQSGANLSNRAGLSRVDKAAHDVRPAPSATRPAWRLERPPHGVITSAEDLEIQPSPPPARAMGKPRS